MNHPWMTKQLPQVPLKLDFKKLKNFSNFSKVVMIWFSWRHWQWATLRPNCPRRTSTTLASCSLRSTPTVMATSLSMSSKWPSTSSRKQQLPSNYQRLLTISTPIGTEKSTTMSSWPVAWNLPTYKTRSTCSTFSKVWTLIILDASRSQRSSGFSRKADSSP